MALSGTPVKEGVEALESAASLDGPAKAIAKQARKLFPRGPVKDLVSGTWLGHPLHPVLTDVVIGSWLSATLLDVLGGDDDGRATQCLLGVGIASAVPTAVSGAVDWADSEVVHPPVRRTGLVHALSNV